MFFIPNEKENALLSKILTIYHGEFTLVRLTSTMLEKSIIDAGQNIRTLFKEHGIVDYSSIIPGEEKVMIQSNYISNTINKITVSCYRPQTKKGDPRFWIYGLKKLLRFNEMIYISVYNNEICIIPLVDELFNPELISEFFESTISNVTECITLIKKFANTNILSVSPYTLNSKDIGDTLERELNIPSNSSKLADFKNSVELKAKRKGVKTKDTLFSMVPNWNKSNIQSSADMILTYGYKSKKYEDYIDLYVTVSNVPNKQGLYLEVDEDNQLVCQKHKDLNGVISNTCVWTFSELKDRLYTKHPETLWIIGEKLEINNKIYFNYESAEYTHSPIFSSFLLLISQGIISYDWRGRVKFDHTGYKDKGHCFRLKPKYRYMLFGKIEEVEF